jgi:hypothetical protein
MESLWGLFVPLEFQMARFRRGDSTRLAATTDVTDIKLFDAFPIAGVLTLSTGPQSPQVQHRLENRFRFVFSPIVATDSALVGLEIQTAQRGVGWLRFGMSPLPAEAQRLQVSDVALYQLSDSAVVLPQTLEEMLPRMLPRTRLVEQTKVGLFWEMYGLAQGERCAFALSARSLDNKGVPREATRRLFGGTTNPMPMYLQWEDAPALGLPIEGRALTVDLSTLEPGRYRLILSASVPGQAPVNAERDIEITKRR